MADKEVKLRTVYCLTKKTPDETYDVYVGRTSMSLEKRLSDHKSNAKQKRKENIKVYKRMNEVGVGNWKIVPLLTQECTRDEIRAFERKWFEVLEADLNSISPMTTAEEVKRRKAEYRENNREEVKQWSAERYRRNREELCRRSAEHNVVNREEISKKSAERHRRNRDSKKFFCEICDIACGSKGDLKHHNETLKHQYAVLNSLD